MKISKHLFRLLFGRRLPFTNRIINVMGINAPVEIRRDGYGIPYIAAQNDVDAWFGLGFCQGQDRFFQIEMLQRITSGTLSALIGPAGLSIDKLSRRIGFWRIAEKQMVGLDHEARDIFEAFAGGVNAGLLQGLPRKPHEYALLRQQPARLSPTGIMALTSFISLGLSTWASKLTRLIILDADGPEAVAALDANYASWQPVTLPSGGEAGRVAAYLGDDMARLMRILSEEGASNNWAVNSSRSATGRPILANDPHLAPTAPPPWYLASIKTPHWHVSGAAYAGSPTFASAHNGTAAWGVTAGLADNLDLYIEQIGEDGISVREGDKFVPCEIVEELIEVKGQPPVVEKVLMTRRGPVISAALEGVNRAVSMQAVWMKMVPEKGLLNVHKSRSFEEFRENFRQYPTSLNMVYADITGTIGWQLVGAVPQREEGYGVIPQPGWVAGVGWLPDFVPFEEIPFVTDPEAGFVATANAKPVSDGETMPYLGSDWADGYREARIVELLRARDDWTLEAIQQMQRDEVSIPWREMRDFILNLPDEIPTIKLTFEYLAAWDGSMSADSTAAGIFSLFLSEMAWRIARVKAPNSAEWAMGKGFNPLVLFSSFGMRRLTHMVELFREKPDGWFAQGWAAEGAEALVAAVNKLRDIYGADPAGWAWGTIRPLTLAHPLGGQKLLRSIFNIGPFPWGGSGQTISAAGRRLLDPTLNPGAIANMRMAVDVGNWENNYYVLAGGQSGNPLSPHYDDQVELWKRGEGITIAWLDDSAEQVISDVLKLNPV